MKHQVISRQGERTTTPGGKSVLPRVFLLTGILCLGFGLVSCGDQEQPARQAPPVTVGKPVAATIPAYQIFTGSSRAIMSADVVARVAGALETIEFAASSQVKAGDLLFTIEDTRYRAERDAAYASLKSAEADLLRAETELRRTEEASKNRAVSEMDVDRARADRDMAIAAVCLAKAKLDNAVLQLSYTRVTAPFDGVVSRNLVDVGNLVGQSGPTLLTRINKLQPIYVFFHAPESLVLKFLAGRERGENHEGGQDETGAAGVALANETGYPHRGVIDYVDNEVDAQTGTIEMRVRLENEDLAIFPGLFVRVKVTGPKFPDAVLVPEVAVSTDLGGKYVLTVGENNFVAQQFVTLGAPQDSGLVHITEGLTGDETLIVNGLMRARPGLPVTPLTPEQFKAMQEQAAKDKKSGQG